MNDNLVDRLENWEQVYIDDYDKPEGSLYIEAADRIKKLEKALALYKRERERFRHAKPEITGEYFLAGGHGQIDDNMLPEYVRIVPAYGCAWEQIYVKTDETISYEGG